MRGHSRRRLLRSLDVHPSVLPLRSQEQALLAVALSAHTRVNSLFYLPSEATSLSQSLMLYPPRPNPLPLSLSDKASAGLSRSTEGCFCSHSLSGFRDITTAGSNLLHACCIIVVCCGLLSRESTFRPRLLPAVVCLENPTVCANKSKGTTRFCIRLFAFAAVLPDGS